ncbi:MAG: cation-translocating P-type ATPase, partial [Clostridiales bacterium]|nr:cation-translocating P-type ATPase [Clostridiales bacterium]
SFADDADFSEEQIRLLKLLAMTGNATAKTDDSGKIEYMGSATEIAMLRLLNEKGFGTEVMAKEYPRVAEIPFSSDRKMSSVVLKDKESGFIVLTMGAFDRLPFGSEIASDLETARRVHDDFAGKALRVLALAGKRVDRLLDSNRLGELEHDLKLIGLVGLIDPPRPEAAISIEEAHKAGVHTVMITGDHAATAEAIAKELGILEEGKHVMTGAGLARMCEVELHDTVRNYTVYARVSPEDKIRIVKAWQANGEVVAMTGDGVNDAPALKAADIGVAMGKTGTEVTKSASDMILTDDNFATIVKAIAEGRNVYRIVKMVIYFLLVCNFSEILIMLVGQMAGWGMVLTPVMLLMINLLGDGIPGLSLAKEVSDPDLMKQKPIKKEASLFGGGLLRLILRQAIFCTIVVLTGYYIGAFIEVSSSVQPSALVGQTMAFLICGWTSIVHIFHVRTPKSVFKTSIRNNKSLALSAAAMVILFGLLVVFPIGELFGLTAIGGFHWLAVIGLSTIPTLLREFCRVIENIPLKLITHVT